MSLRFRLSLQMALVFLCVTVPIARALPVEGTLLGHAPYAFTLPTLDGGTVKLTDSLGARGLALVFWASWSENSALELAEVEKLHRRWKEQGLTVLGIAVDNQTMAPNDVQAVRAARDRLRLTFPVLLDQRLETFKEYGVVAVPSTVLVSSEGKVIHTLAGYPLAARVDLVSRIEAMVTGTPLAPLRAVFRPVPKALRLYNLARRQLRMGFTSVAEARLDEAIKADPKFAAPLTLLGQIRLDAGRLADAEQALRQATSLDSEDRAAFAELGRLLIEKGDLVEARNALERCVALNAGYSPAHWYLGLLAAREGKPAEADDHFKTAESLNAREPRLYLYRGRAAESQGRTDAALEDYRRALDLLLPESWDE